VLQVSGGQALVQPMPKALEPFQLSRQVLIDRRRLRRARAKECIMVSGLEPRETQGEARLLRPFALHRWERQKR
jgi:hypothetical protein